MIALPEWFTEEGQNTVQKGYLLPNEENICDGWMRVAKQSNSYLKIPGFTEDLFDVLYKGLLGLASPVLSNFGTNRGLPISCYSVEMPDSINGMFSQYKHMAALSKNGGGVGCYWQNVRPANSDIGESNGKSNGSVPFAVLADRVASTVSQGGVRRGSFSHYWCITHPDFKQALLSKDHNGDIRKYIDGNIAVTIPDWWMEELIAGDEEKKELMNLIVKTRLKTGSPYIIFIDTINKNRPDAYKIHNLLVKLSNICTEISLFTDINHSFVCCLSSINDSKFDEVEKYRSPNLGLTVPEIAIYLLDSVITDFIIKTTYLPNWLLTNDFLKKITKYIPFNIKEGTYTVIEFLGRFLLHPFYKFPYPSMGRARRSALKERALGLGTMGLADYFQQKGLVWGSEGALEADKKIHFFKKQWANKASRDLAKKFGQPFWCKGTDKRNSHLIALAPTKSNAAITNAGSEGVSPYEMNSGVAIQAKGTFLRKNRNLYPILQKYGLDTYETWMDIAQNNGSILQIPEIPIYEKLIFLTGREIDPSKLIKHAAVRQPEVDQAMSTNGFASPFSSVKSLIKPIVQAWAWDVKTLYYLKSSSSTSLENMMRKAYIITQPDCVYCAKTKLILSEKNYEIVEFKREDCKENFVWDTVPIIWADGHFIGGYTDLIDYFEVLFKKDNEPLKIEFQQTEMEDCESCHA